MRQLRLTCLATILVAACGGGGTPATAPDMATDMAMTGCPAWVAPSGAGGSCGDIAYECYQHGSCNSDGDCTNGHCWNHICGGCNASCDCMGDSKQTAMCDTKLHRCAGLSTEGCTGGDACFNACDALAKKPQYGMDAEALWTCIGNSIASGAACETPCGPSGTTCSACLFGTCTGAVPMQSCTGGACSIQAQTCDNDI